jgi:hypothetical protein
MHDNESSSTLIYPLFAEATDSSGLITVTSLACA